MCTKPQSTHLVLRGQKPLDYFITILYLLVEKYFNLLKLIEFLIAVLKLCSILHATQTLS